MPERVLGNVGRYVTAIKKRPTALSTCERSTGFKTSVGWLDGEAAVVTERGGALAAVLANLVRSFLSFLASSFATCATRLTLAASTSAPVATHALLPRTPSTCAVMRSEFPGNWSPHKQLD